MGKLRRMWGISLCFSCGEMLGLKWEINERRGMERKLA